MLQNAMIRSPQQPERKHGILSCRAQGSDKESAGSFFQGTYGNSKDTGSNYRCKANSPMCMSLKRAGTRNATRLSTGKSKLVADQWVLSFDPLLIFCLCLGVWRSCDRDPSIKKHHKPIVEKSFCSCVCLGGGPHEQHPFANILQLGRTSNIPMTPVAVPGIQSL